MIKKEGNFSYQYTVENFNLFTKVTRVFIQIGDNKFPIIGVATVKVAVAKLEEPLDLQGVFTDLRYIFVNIRGEPDVSYRENPGFMGITK